jgi:hypothetical protein
MSSDDPPHTPRAEEHGGQEHQSADGVSSAPPVCANGKPQPSTKKWWQEPTHLLQTGTLLFVGAYTLLTYCSWQTSQETLIESQRAFVIFHTGHVTPNGNGPSFDITFKIGNDGNTATGGLRIILNCIRQGLPAEEPFDFLKWNDRETFRDIIPPKSEIDIAPNVRANCHFSFDEVGSIRDGILHAYLLGEARYADIITRKPRVTEFAKELTAEIGAIPGNAIISAISRGQHNCADEDCPND